MSFGFSVGDFLAAGKLIYDITTSLSSSSGSKSEYQELIRELDSLSLALKHVEKLGSHNPGVSTSTLNSIRCAALLCRHPLEDFLGKVQKYEGSLGVWGKEKGLRAVGRKVDWALRKKDDVRMLRDYLVLHVGSINMLLLGYGLELVDLASSTAVKDQADLKEVLRVGKMEVMQHSSSLAVAIRGDQAKTVEEIQENRSLLTKLFAMVRGDIAAPLKILAKTVVGVCVSTQQILSLVLEIRSFMPSVDTRYTHFQTPVKVEDTLGRIFPVPSEYTYGDLEAIIQRRFQSGPGHVQVQNGNFELFNSKTKTRLLSSLDEVLLRPGMNVTMAVILEELCTKGETCPMPHCESVKISSAVGGGRTCDECGVWFDNNRTCKKRKAPYVDIEGLRKLPRIDDRYNTGNITERSVWIPTLPISHISPDSFDAFRNIKVQGMVDLSIGVKKSRLIVRCKECGTHLASKEVGDKEITIYTADKMGDVMQVRLATNVTQGEGRVHVSAKYVHDIICVLHCRNCRNYVGWAVERTSEVEKRHKVCEYFLETESTNFVECMRAGPDREFESIEGQTSESDYLGNNSVLVFRKRMLRQPVMRKAYR